MFAVWKEMITKMFWGEGGRVLITREPSNNKATYTFIPCNAIQLVNFCTQLANFCSNMTTYNWQLVHLVQQATGNWCI